MDLNYAHVPLAKKLGISENDSLVVINKPTLYEQTLGEISNTLTIHNRVNNLVDFIHYFAHNKSDLIHKFPELKHFLTPSGMLWISWPKKSSHIPSDLDENTIIKIGLENGLVDVKVVSFDETWSALKFIYRLKNR